jgi:serine/threonine protein kinase
MTKYDTYIKRNSACHRLNDSIYRTKVKGVDYIIKDTDLHRDSEYYMAIREISVLLHLKHPNIISMVDHFIHNDRLYIVLPFIEKSLYDLERQYRKEDKTFTPDQTKKILTGLLKGLHYLHENDICHRDLKPDNIMILDDFTPIIIDFGQAKKLTMANTTSICTSFYRPPEVAGFVDNESSKLYDKRVDVWGVGCIAYELLTNEQLAMIGGDDSVTEESVSEGVFTDGSETDNSHSESDWESDSVSSDGEDEELNGLVIQDLFRKLGVPAKSVLDMYNLAQFVTSDMDKSRIPLTHFQEKNITNQVTLKFMLNVLCIDPTQRYTIHQCITDPYINGSPEHVEPVKQRTEIIDIKNSKFNMGKFQEAFKKNHTLLRSRGVREDVLKKSKRLCLLYISRYTQKIPNSWLEKMIAVCIYICDNLLGNTILLKIDYLDLFDVGKRKFNTILVDVTKRTLEDLYVI